MGAPPSCPAAAVDAHHLGAQVGQQHAAERRGADAGDFDDPDALERALCLLCHGCSGF